MQSENSVIFHETIFWSCLKMFWYNVILGFFRIQLKFKFIYEIFKFNFRLLKAYNFRANVLLLISRLKAYTKAFKGTLQGLSLK